VLTESTLLYKHNSEEGADKSWKVMKVMQVIDNAEDRGENGVIKHTQLVQGNDFKSIVYYNKGI
jgi:hypothetical protein